MQMHTQQKENQDTASAPSNRQGDSTDSSSSQSFSRSALLAKRLNLSDPELLWGSPMRWPLASAHLHKASHVMRLRTHLTFREYHNKAVIGSLMATEYS
jgi:hypothetical protein